MLGTVNEGATKIVFPYFPFSLLDKVGQFNTIKVKKPHLVTALNKILQTLHLVLKKKLASHKFLIAMRFCKFEGVWIKVFIQSLTIFNGRLQDYIYQTFAPLTPNSFQLGLDFEVYLPHGPRSLEML